MSDDAVALVKESLSLADLVGRYVQLKRKGNRLAACCPFHNEKTPSFYVDPAKGFFHCFGCGAGGDLIRFAMDIEGMTFREALEFLADIAGVDLPKFRGKGGPSKDVVDAYRAINEEAVNFYHQNLVRNKPAMAYLAERGIKPSTVNLFKLGYAPNQWDGLINHMRNRFDGKLLSQCGLFKQSDKGRVYDMFRDRVIFPIRDSLGNTIAFGGRLIEGDGPKYINSPETPIYKKGKHLYNMDLAKNLLKSDKVDAVVVVEGYMDVIQVYQAGVMNVIASLGTAFTPEQARLIQRHTDKVLLNFDGDRAGFKAARSSIEVCLQKDLKIGVVSLPGGQDPDDYIKENGVKAYREQLEQADTFYDFLLAYFSKDRDIQANPHERSFLAQEVCSTLKFVEDPVVRGFYLEKLAGDLEVPNHVLMQLVEQSKAPPQPKPKPKPQQRRQQPPRPQPQRGPQQQGYQPPGPGPASGAGHDYGMDHEPMHYIDDFGGEPVYDEFGQPMHHDMGDFGMDPGFGQAPASTPPAGYGSPAGQGRGQSVRRRRLATFNLIEQEFLYHVMTQADFTTCFKEENRASLPQILQLVFRERAWILQFIYFDKVDAGVEARLEAIPEEYRSELRGICMSDAWSEEDAEKLDILFLDLVESMMEEMIDLNKKQLRALPPSEVDKFRELRQSQHKLKKELQLIRQS